MMMRKLLLAGFGLLLLAAPGQTQERRLFGRPICPPKCDCPPPAALAPSPDSSKPPPDQVAKPPQSSAFNEALASAGEGGTQPAAGYMPGMFGDILGGFTTTQVFIPALDGFVTVQIPNGSQSAGYKISENESPRPIDRIFYNFNFYGGIVISPDATVPLLQLNRHVIGFEKTFLAGDASIGMRLPFLGLGGDPSLQTMFTGDLSFVFKYAFYYNLETGNLVSGGLVVACPTGGRAAFRDPDGNRTLVMPPTALATLQPWLGFIYNVTPNLYVHGFNSTSIPIDAGDVTFMSNDVGLGYWLYRGAGSLLGVIPTVEMHINTPFDHRGVGPVVMNDQVSLTAGSYFLFSHAVVGGAIGIPFNGPNKIEALASINWRF